MQRTIFDYEVVKPDQSEIKIKKGYAEYVGSFIWDERKFEYNFLGEKAITREELKEILISLIKLNKKSVLPKWLQWSTNK